MYRGIDGRGHTRSFVLSGQNSLILSYKYHCRSVERPVGVKTVGSSVFDGKNEGSRSKLIVFCWLLEYSFIVTSPIDSEERLKLWNLFIPGSFLNFSK